MQVWTVGSRCSWVLGAVVVGCGGRTTGVAVDGLGAGSRDGSGEARSSDGGVAEGSDGGASVTQPDDLPETPDDFFEGLWAVTYHSGEPPGSFGWVRLGADGTAYFQPAPDMYAVWTCDGRGTWAHRGASAIDLALPSACFYGTASTTFTVKQASDPPRLRDGSYASAYLAAPPLAQWMSAYKFPSSRCYPTIVTCAAP